MGLGSKAQRQKRDAYLLPGPEGQLDTMTKNSARVNFRCNTGSQFMFVNLTTKSASTVLPQDRYGRFFWRFHRVRIARKLSISIANCGVEFRDMN